ncbi:MAG: transporter, partial [Saprospiraceae bacterium]|nr:transporter [Pyrinomonadaceae bacterium]
ASNGSSPVDLITRVEVKYQYQNFSGGDLHGIPIIRGDYAFSRTASIRLDLPILHFDAQTPGQSSETGIGDIVLSATFVKAFSKKFIGAFGPRIDFPTATDDRLGSGKYVLKPLVAGVTPLAPGLAFVGILEYRVSIAGKDHRADVNEIAIKPVLLKSFLTGPLKGTYANPQLEFIVDFETNNRTTTQLGVNLGKVLSKNVVLFVVPTFHIAGTKRESFKLEAGFRYLFR